MFTEALLFLRQLSEDQKHPTQTQVRGVSTFGQNIACIDFAGSFL
jgi:hypothetical protein